MKIILRLLLAIIGLLSLHTLDGKTFEQGVNKVEVPQVLVHRDRAEPINQILKHRLDVLLPQLMSESELDMWLVINREYGEDAL